MHIRFIFIVGAMFVFLACNSGQKTNESKMTNTALLSEMDSIHVNKEIWCFKDTSNSFFSSAYKLIEDTSENNCLQSCGGNVIRKEDTLILKMDNGGTKRYVNNNSIESDNYTEYRFISRLNEINYYLIKIYYYEGYSYLMLNAKSGKESYLWGVPSISPDKKKIIASCFDLQAGFVFNGIQFYTVTNDSLQLQWSRELSKWGADKIAWVNNDLLVAERLMLDSTYNTKTSFITLSQCN